MGGTATQISNFSHLAVHDEQLARLGALDKSRFTREFRMSPFLFWVVRHAVGATMPNLNTSILGALPLIKPPTELQSKFAGIVGSWDERGAIALDQSQSLAALRDALLSKLLSGELSVN